MHDEFGSVLRAAQAGSEWAWSRLYHDLAGRVFGYLRTQGAHDPEGLLGDVFLQVARNTPDFEGDERSFRSWVFTIAHHRVIDERRYRSRRPVDPYDDLSGLGETGDVEQEALDSLTSGRVQELIEQLTPDQRDVLLLRVVGDLTVAQVAGALEKAPGTVKALQRRGLAALQRLTERRGVPL
ncbi:MAG: RNA polymerase sigma factor [Acidimicrobiia bacterium]